MTGKDDSTFGRNLEELQEFPCTWPFKFIVPAAQVEQAKALFPAETVTLRESSGGKYVSVSADVRMESADVVRAVYEKASTIKGLLAI